MIFSDWDQVWFFRISVKDILLFLTSFDLHFKELSNKEKTHFCIEKERKYKAKERMKDEEIEKGDCGPPTRKVFFFFFEILSDLNQAVPNHLADESQTR